MLKRGTRYAGRGVPSLPPLIRPLSASYPPSSAPRAPRPAHHFAFALIAYSSIQASTVFAQSRLIPTDHWSYEYVNRLRSRGYLENLNPLVQPYRAGEVVVGLAELDPDTLAEPVAGWVRILREEYVREEGGASWGLEISAGARASTSARLDPLRPTGGKDAWPWYSLGGWATTGPVTAEVRLHGDNYLNQDPDGLDPGQRRGGRSDHAYVAADFPVGSIFLGRIDRNWSVGGTRGLLVSDVTTSYPQLGFELRAGRFSLRSFTGELETLGGLKRYVAAHRIDYSTEKLTLSFGESILYANTSGMQLRWLNPLEFLFFDHDNQPNDATQNLMLNVQAWYRAGRFVLNGEFLLDDIDVAPGDRVAEPPVYAFKLGIVASAVAPWLDLGFEYEQVSAWAYRTPNVIDSYSFLDRGLGENFSDYDRLTLRADLHPPLFGLRLTPILQVQRQGEGNFRDSIIGGYAGEPAIFLGQKETTYRVGLRARYQPIRHFWIAFDMGENWVRGKDHVAGTNVSEFEALVEVGGIVSFPLRRRR